jgi:hypothetical protein
MGALEKTTRDVADGIRASISVHASAKIHERGEGEPDPASGPDGGAVEEPAASARRVRAPFGNLG